MISDKPARADSLDAYKVCRRGDIVFNKMSIRAGALGVASEDGLVTYHYEVMRPRSGSDARFLVYLMKSAWFVSELVKRERGIGAGEQANVRTTEVPFRVLRTISVWVPDLHEQRAIADYLDRETAQIDALIEKQERLIATVRERLDAVKERHLLGRSDVRVTTVRRALTKRSRRAVIGLGVITAYRDGRVTKRSNRREEGYTMSDLEQGYQEILPGEVVFHGMDGFAGAVGVSDSHGNATPVYHACVPSGVDDPEFIALHLRQLGTSGLLATLAPNVRQRSVDFRNWATFGRVPLELPDPEAQRRAVKDIRYQEARVALLVAKAERLIELSRERRAALITAAVTGQIDVGSAA
ncbi:hypothetical protein [Aeromicrobium sp.]|uniref:hypothetical protein n=1 Tax=Aeromicrobium sp. TaxID=1871063 RepID=UPI002FC7034B